MKKYQKSIPENLRHRHPENQPKRIKVTNIGKKIYYFFASLSFFTIASVYIAAITKTFGNSWLTILLFAIFVFGIYSIYRITKEEIREKK